MTRNGAPTPRFTPHYILAVRGEPSDIATARIMSSENSSFWHLQAQSCGSIEMGQVDLAGVLRHLARRMAAAKRYPSIAVHGVDGFRKGLNHPNGLINLVLGYA